MASKTFPGNYSSLDPISKFIAEEAELAGLDENTVYSIQLAVDEACTNIIEHAYGGEGVGDIVCICSSDPSAFEVELRDKGQSFDPKSIQDPDVGVPLENLKSRGAGVFLMNKLMDEVSFDFTNVGETRLKMLKKK
jgi:serine/threonine-protein kinase RsbW